MEKEQRANMPAHCLVLLYPIQGHINPLLQFSKILDYKQVKVTLVTTRFIYNTMNREPSTIKMETISDGYDEGGYEQADSMQAYGESFKRVGRETLNELFKKLTNSGCPVDCLIYDAVMSWALDVAKQFGTKAAVFFTQSCAVDNIYYHVNKGLLKLPLAHESEISLQGMPPLMPLDFPSFVYDAGAFPSLFEIVIGQFENVERADWVLCNTVYEWEEQVVDRMTDFFPVRTVGPTIPSAYLDKRVKEDKNYGINLFKPKNDVCINWLNQQPQGSVAYVSFGSTAIVNSEQMEELTWGLRSSKSKFLWVVRELEASKLPEGFIEETAEKGLVVSWCSQLEVLAHEAVGCFITHCGWNSTLEALSLGVPVVAMAQWSDQPTNSKYIVDVWKTGVKAQPDQKGIVRREEIEHSISELMEGERGKEIQRNAMKWKDLARKAVDDGGSSDRNINEFIHFIAN